jgi:hypothetical protein
MPMADAGKCGCHAWRRCLGNHQTRSTRPRFVRVLPPGGNHNLCARSRRRERVPNHLSSGEHKAARHRQRSSRMSASAVAKRSSRSSKQPRTHALFHRQTHQPRTVKPHQPARQPERHRGKGCRAGSRKSRLRPQQPWPRPKPAAGKRANSWYRFRPERSNGSRSHCRSQK